MKRNIEIRQAEGGEDSALFVSDLAAAYTKLFVRKGWTHSLVSARLGEIIIAVESKDLTQLDNEPGGLRLQRVPPTERKGRVHTSTVTVAVIDPTVVTVEIQDRDLRVEWFSGTGCGGQHKTSIKTLVA